MTESMAEEWEKWITQEQSNVTTLEERIEELESKARIEDLFYREFWEEANQVSELFETLTPLPNGIKEHLHAKYDRICQGAKKRQEQEWKTRRMQSKERRTMIETKITEAYACAESAPEDSETLARAQALLSEALGWLKSDGEESDQATPVTGFLREDKQVCWDQWREANEIIFNRRRAIWDHNYGQVNPDVKVALDEANADDPFQALEKVKAIQSKLKEMPMIKTQRDEIRLILNSAWEIAIAKANEIREGKRKKHEEWLQRMEDNVRQWTDLIRKNNEEASELREQVDRLTRQAKDAGVDEHANALRDWVQQKRQRIGEIAQANRELEENIRSFKERLSS